jgi:hypothetical protein
MQFPLAFLNFLERERERGWVVEYFAVIQKSKKQKSKELPQTCNACELLLFLKY